MRDRTSMWIDLRSKTEMEAYWTGDYELPLLRLLERIVVPKCVFLDVGANIGFVTIAVGQILRQQSPRGRVIAFEPVRSNFERLRENLAMNGLEEFVQTLCVGLGAERSQATIVMENANRASTGNAFISMQGVGLASGIASTIGIEKLDDIFPTLNVERLDVIKLDIEGAEYMFLRGAMESINRFHPLIIGEFNSYFIRQLGDSVTEADVMLRTLDYKPFRISRRGLHPVLRRIPEVIDGDSDLLFVTQDKEHLIHSFVAQ